MMDIEQLFTPLAYGLLVVLMGLLAWWCFRAYKKALWVRFTFALILFVLLGFGWSFFPILLFLLLAPIFGWSFT